jgi:hypothetical protein
LLQAPDLVKRKGEIMNIQAIRHWGVSLAGALFLIVAPSMGQTTDNFQENFEGFAVDDLIIPLSAFWSGPDNEAGVIVATNYTANYVGGGFPILYDHAVSNHVLQFEGDITNTIPAGTANQTNWVDMVLKPTFASEGEEPPLPETGSVASFYFNESGNLVVSHTPSNAVTPVVWVEIPEVQVQEDEWIRLTVAANLKDGSFMTDNFTRLYQVYVNGRVVTNSHAFQTPDRASGSDGTWFGAAAGIGIHNLTGPVFSGTGFVDDMVVQNSKPVMGVDPTQVDWPTLAGPSVYGVTLADLTLIGGEARDAANDPIPGVFSFVLPGSTIPPAGTNAYQLRFTPDDSAAFNNVQNGYVDVEITPRAITITADSFSKEEGDLYTFDGTEYTVAPALVGSDAITSVDLASSGAAAGAAPGDYEITITNAVITAQENYTVTYSNGTLTVFGTSLETPVIAVPPTASDITYGQTLGNSSFSGAVVTNALGDSVAGTFAFETPGFAPTAGTSTYAFVFSPSNTAKYNSVTSSVDVVTLRRPLAITADARQTTLGAPVSFVGNEYSVDPELINADSITNVDIDSTGKDADTAGAFPITVANATGSGLVNYDITYLDGTLVVLGPEDPTPAWLAATSVSYFDLDDDRGDGVTLRQAWLASVDPFDTSSEFRVERIWSENSTNHIRWVSVYVDESLPPFAIWARTNLMDTTYEIRGMLERPAGAPSATPITNVWSEPSPPYPVFYRVAATNDVVTP